MTKLLNEDMLVNKNNTLQSENTALKDENRALKREISMLTKQIEILRYFATTLSEDKKQILFEEFLSKIQEDYTKNHYTYSYQQIKWD